MSPGPAPCACATVGDIVRVLGPSTGVLAVICLVTAMVLLTFAPRQAAMFASSGAMGALLAVLFGVAERMVDHRWWWSGWGTPWELATVTLLVPAAAFGAFYLAAVVVAAWHIKRHRAHPEGYPLRNFDDDQE